MRLMACRTVFPDDQFLIDRHAGDSTPKRRKPATMAEESRDGAKSVLFAILKAADQPLTSAKLWEAAEVTLDPLIAGDPST